MKSTSIRKGIILTTLICDECNDVCNSDIKGHPRYWWSFITVTVLTGIHTGKITHYCNEDCRDKSNNKRSE